MRRLRRSRWHGSGKTTTCHTLVRLLPPSARRIVSGRIELLGWLVCGVGVGWWTEDNPHLDGEFFCFRDVGFAPKPVQKPHPPIWVGGDSPGAFRRVVTLGDGWHATSKDPAQLREALARLQAVAETHNRDMKTIDISVRVSLSDAQLAQGPQPVIDQMAEYKRLGLTHVVIDFRRDDLAQMLDLLDLVTGTIRPAVERG